MPTRGVRLSKFKLISETASSFPGRARSRARSRGRDGDGVDRVPLLRSRDGRRDPALEPQIDAVARIDESSVAPVRRVHLFEFEDLPWVPAAIRDGGTDLLDFGFARLGFYRALAPKLRELIEKVGATRITDLCSGGGGGALALRAELLRDGRPDLEWVFTDRNPNAAAIERVRALDDPRARYHADPVDALDAGGALPGLRTMFGALHHFRPPEVRRLLRGVMERGHAVALFDVAASPALRRVPLALAPLAMAPNMVMLTIATLVAVPFIRPWKASRWIFTYAVPLIPLLVAWDGTVSAMRAYTPDELLAMAAEADVEGRYRWDAGVGGKALYLCGRPRALTPRAAP
jgi:hypothetical protein